jgi:hypothetical protein
VSSQYGREGGGGAPCLARRAPSAFQEGEGSGGRGCKGGARGAQALLHPAHNPGAARAGRVPRPRRGSGWGTRRVRLVRGEGRGVSD